MAKIKTIINPLDFKEYREGYEKFGSLYHFLDFTYEYGRPPQQILKLWFNSKNRLYSLTDRKRNILCYNLRTTNDVYVETVKIFKLEMFKITRHFTSLPRYNIAKKIHELIVYLDETRDDLDGYKSYEIITSKEIQEIKDFGIF